MIRSIIILFSMAFLLVKPIRADEMFMPELVRIFSSDLVIDASYKSSNEPFFWVTINEVIKGDEYGLRKGDVLRVKNIHHGGCGFPYNVESNKRMRLCLINKAQQWELIFNSSSSISPISEGKSYLSMRDETFHLNVHNMNIWLRELLKCYKVIEGEWRFTRLCEKGVIEQEKSSNQLMSQLEKQGLSEVYQTENELREELTTKRVEKEKKVPYCYFLDKEASYAGGQDGYYSFLDSNLVMPRDDIEGTVYLRVIVDTEGKVTCDSLLRGVHPNFDEEAIRVVNSMPSWTPAQSRGQAAKCYLHLPVKFRRK